MEAKNDLMSLENLTVLSKEEMIKIQGGNPIIQGARWALSYYLRESWNSVLSQFDPFSDYTSENNMNRA